MIGVEDWDAERFDSSRHSSLPQALKGVPKDAFKLLLAHQPKAAPEASTLGMIFSSPVTLMQDDLPLQLSHLFRPTL